MSSTSEWPTVNDDPGVADDPPTKAPFEFAAPAVKA